MKIKVGLRDEDAEKHSAGRKQASSKQHDVEFVSLVIQTHLKYKAQRLSWHRLLDRHYINNSCYSLQTSIEK
jgi:hypothetical protein